MPNTIEKQRSDQQTEAGSIFYNAKNYENLNECEDSQFSAQSDIFDKVALIQQKRDEDLQEVFCCYPLGAVLWVLADAVGVKATTPKSKLMQHLEKGTRVEEVPHPFGLVIDGTAFVR